MKKILGLDLGTTSIGWALVEVDDNGVPQKIVAMGSRIIQLTSDDKEQFTKGQTISKNQDRTKARTLRKGYDRKQLKKSDDFKYSLKKVLDKYGIYPDKGLFNMPMLELWHLRSKAASEPISPEQLGRILYMLNQKRGYKSARNEENIDNKDTDRVEEIKNRYSELKEKQQTIGQNFYNELANACKNNSYYRVKDKVYPREAYIEEFDTIMNVQKGSHSFLTDDVIENLRNEIIYYQRKLKSQKGLVSECEFESRILEFKKDIFKISNCPFINLKKRKIILLDKHGYRVRIEENLEIEFFEKFYASSSISFSEFKSFLHLSDNKELYYLQHQRVSPKSSPLFQLCKIWEVVNNITLKTKNPEGSRYKWSDRALSLDEKQQIANYLFYHPNLSFAELLKILDLRKEDVYINKQISKGIQGNITYSAIHALIGDCKHLAFNISFKSLDKKAKLVDKKTGEILEEFNALQVDPDIEQEPLFKLWHTIYSIKDINECKNALIKRFEFSEEVAQKLSLLDFNKQGFGNKSNKAIRNIMPYLMQGYNYSDSCSLAGYNHSNSLTKDERSTLITIDRLKLLPKNSLRQPVVEKILNQMINVVNALIDEYSDKDENGKICKYWKPDEIRVELARELKQSKEERNDSTLNNTANEVINNEIANRLKEMGVKTTKRFIEKYKLIFPIRTVIDSKTGKALPKKLKDAVVTNQCIYCGKFFSLSEALTGDDFDVDHIVPKDLLPIDNSLMNKVLVHRHCNATKNNLTAYDYITKQGDNALQLYIDRVDDWYKRGIITYGKMLRLKVSYEEYLERKKIHKETDADKKLWEDFLARDLKATQYIARKSTEILRLVCNNVTATEGKVTATLRRLWGWDDILMNLHLPKYKELEEKTGQKFTQIKEWESDKGKRKHKKEEIIGWDKRDDHRHHAIDALVIACTKQGYIQRINTLNASETKADMQKEIDAARLKFGNSYDENILTATNEIVNNHSGRLTKLDEYLINQKPFTTKEVMKEADKILVSFKAGKKVATISKYKAIGKNEKTGVITPRGALHEAGLYGRIKLKREGGVEEEHIIKKYKVGISAQDHIFTGKETYSIKTDKNGNTKVDDKIDVVLNSIVDNRVREIVLNKLNESFTENQDYRSDVKKALDNFRNLEAKPLWYNESKGIKILSIKLKTGLRQESVVPLRIDKNGKEITFVKTGNNHHIAIYESEDGIKTEHLCTFWNAVERKKHKVPIIIKDTRELWNSLINKDLPESFLNKLPSDNLKLKFSMQQNEMFIIGLPSEDFEQALKENNKSFLSRYLYCVQNISSKQYRFANHIETKFDINQMNKAHSRFYNIKSLAALLKLNPIKVRLNSLGEITKVGE